AAIGVGWRIVAEVLLAPTALRFRRSGQWLGTDRRDAGAFAGAYLFAREVAAIGEHGQLVDASRRLRLLAHIGKLASVMADVGDLVGNDEVVGRVDRGLDIIADHARALAVGGHR